MTNIDASLRRPILPENRGSQVPDSKKLLADTPQLVMSPGVSRPVYRFDDGDGLTDAFGNVYDGYGTGGQSRTFSISPAESVDDELDQANDLDVIQYNAGREKYEPKSLNDAGIPVFDVDVQSNLDLAQYNSLTELWEPKSLQELNIAELNGAPQDGDILYYNSANQKWEPADPPTGGGGGTPDPFTITDFISGIIETPQVRTYTIVSALPYDISITSTSSSFATGSGTVLITSGNQGQGNFLVVLITSLSANAEFLRFQINFTRTLTP